MNIGLFLSTPIANLPRRKIISDLLNAKELRHERRLLFDNVLHFPVNRILLIIYFIFNDQFRGDIQMVFVKCHELTFEFRPSTSFSLNEKQLFKAS